MLTSIQEIKKEFFAYRNGIIADMLRKNGDPHDYIMGCQLVDVAHIANRIEHTAQMACQLWNDTKHRECRMIAPMLYPADEMTYETARQWATMTECNEIADVLCHRLLRNLPYAGKLALELLQDDNNQTKYTGWRLMLNLFIIGKVEDKEAIHQLLAKEKAVQPQRDIAQLLDSIEEEM